MARIEKPCYETRVAIVQKKARMRGLTLPEDVVCYIAARVENNTRGIGRRHHQDPGHGDAPERRIDLELAKAALGDTASDPQKRVTIQNILDVVTKYYNVR